MQVKPVGAFSQDCRTTKNGVGTVNVFSENGQELVEVKVNSSFEDTDEPMLVDRLTDAAVNFARSNSLSFKSYLNGPKLNLITPHAGGNNIGSVFSISLLKIDGEKRLLLCLERDGDPGSNTVCMYWIRCLKNQAAEEFKSIAKKCISEMIYDGAYVLRERANLRRGFNKLHN